MMERLDTKIGEAAPKELVSQLAGMVEELRSRGTVGAIGVAIPGLVNRQTDRVIAPRDLPSTIVEDLHGQLMRATGLRVELENDANAAAYGEYKVGAGRGARNLFYMMIGNGIGGAIILDGKLWTGASGFAGEVGHITIDTEGLPCVCGNTGCLETVASAPSIVRARANDSIVIRRHLCRDSHSTNIYRRRRRTSGKRRRRFRAHDDRTHRKIHRHGRRECDQSIEHRTVVLGGGVMDAGSLILNPIIQEVKRRAFQPCFEATDIVAAKLGLDAAPIGAALLARDAATD
jgi:glucokinase